MRFLDAALAFLALSQAVKAREQPASSSSVAPIVTPAAFINGATRPFRRPAKSSLNAHKPEPHGPVGLITTAYVIATVINQIEVVSICATNGAVTTIIQEQATCETYTTCITIPASLCSTFVSTLNNGDLTTCTTPAENWTKILPTAVTSKVHTNLHTRTAHGTKTVASGSDKPAQTGSFGNAPSPQSSGKAGAQKDNPTSHSPTAAQTTYATAGAPRLLDSSLAIFITFLVVALA